MIKKVVYVICGLIFSVGLVLGAVYIGGGGYDEVVDEQYQQSYEQQTQISPSSQEDGEAIKQLKLK